MTSLGRAKVALAVIKRLKLTGNELQVESEYRLACFITSAVDAEREGCAQLAANVYSDEVEALGTFTPQETGNNLAFAIRARANPTNDTTPTKIGGWPEDLHEAQRARGD